MKIDVGSVYEVYLNSRFMPILILDIIDKNDDDEDITWLLLEEFNKYKTNYHFLKFYQLRNL